MFRQSLTALSKFALSIISFKNYILDSQSIRLDNIRNKKVWQHFKTMNEYPKILCQQQPSYHTTHSGEKDSILLGSVVYFCKIFSRKHVSTILQSLASIAGFVFIISNATLRSAVTRKKKPSLLLQTCLAAALETHLSGPPWGFPGRATRVAR